MIYAELGLDGKVTHLPLPAHEAAELEKQWRENFTESCETRNLVLLRSLSTQQRSRLLREAKLRSIASFSGLKSLALTLGLAGRSRDRTRRLPPT